MKIRTLVFAAALLAVLGWGWASTLEWRAERVSKGILTGELSAEAFPSTPLSASPDRYAALSFMANGSADYTQMERHLARSTDLRPLYAPFWLDRAEAAWRSGNPEAARRYLNRAVALWPNRHKLLWEAAMLYAQLGDTPSALGAFKRYLANHPGDQGRVLAVARRLEGDPTALLASLVPDDPKRRDDLLWRFMQTAKSRKDDMLGRAAWRALSKKERSDPDNTRFYVEWMVEMNDSDEALSAWGQVFHTERSAPIHNPGFEQPPSGGLDWRVYVRDGIDVSRDSASRHGGVYSLRIKFSGDENLRFNHVRQYVPVMPGVRYRLDFYWRGDGVSTRSGPFIQLSTLSGEQVARTQDKWGSWDWQPEQLEFQVPGPDRFVELSVRRRKTDAFDSRIKGTLWIDDFSIVPVASVKGE